MKKIHFHIGPHKTGTTALQRYFRAHADLVLMQTGWHYENDPITFKAAIQMQADDVSDMARLVGSLDHDKVLVINEDFCGDFPIRNGAKTLYPNIVAHVQMLQNAFPNDDLSFSFCHRPMTAWLPSVYHQNLRTRGGLRSYARFLQAWDVPNDWGQVLKNLQTALGDRCAIIDYEKSGANLHHALLSVLDAPRAGLPAMDRANASPDPLMVTLLEQINKTNSSPSQKRASKQILLHQSAADLALVRLDSVLAIEGGAYNPWPPTTPDLPDFPELEQRIARDMHPDAQPDLMPDVDVGLHEYRTQFLPAMDAEPMAPRTKMADQQNMLRYEFRGKSELHLMHGLAISYLRRNTDHTQKARVLFHRLWNEEHAVLLGTLKTRWFISAFQTFADHGLSADQRQIGAAAYYYANMIKVHEAERSLDGTEPDATYPHITPSTRLGFKGLDRYKLGNSDILPNMNAHLLGLALQDATAGRVVIEFMRRARNADTVFSRMDANRIAHDIDNPNFQGAWSFGAAPKK